MTEAKSKGSARQANGNARAKARSNRRDRDNSRHETKPGLQARIAATRLLGAVVDGKASLDGLLDREHGNPHFLALSDSDRGLVRAILLTALRHLTVIDAIIDSLTEKPLPAGARSLRHLLAIAIAQILHLEVADHAAVDLAVSQADADPRNRRFASLVNAVLRRLIRERDTLPARVVAVTDPFPEWFMARLRSAYDAPTVAAITDALKVPAPLDLSVREDAEGWADKLGGTVLPTGTVRIAPGGPPVSDLPGFDEGAWWVQDAAAAIPARLFGSLEGKRVADLCAAPGGKTAQLILAGGEVIAFDQSASRLKRLDGNLARLGLSAETRKERAEKVSDEAGFDAVLLDAPCSSTGTVRRHPDVVWTKSADDITKLARVQRSLLDHAVTLVKPDGVLVFSNCSLDREEGEAMISDFLADHRDWAIVPVKPELLPGLEMAITDKGEIRTHPAMLADRNCEISGMDGFYAVVLQRS